MFQYFSNKLNKKGFTLAELLIVIAIIAVLVAIAIPVYSAQVNNANEAVDQANLRAATSMAVADYMLSHPDGKGGETSYYAFVSTATESGASNIAISTNASATGLGAQLAGKASAHNNGCSIKIGAGGKIIESAWNAKTT